MVGSSCAMAPKSVSNAIFELAVVMHNSRPGFTEKSLFAGIAGGAGPNLAAADVGTTVAEIYDPSQPEGMRWRSVADSQIWRLYHSIAFLTRNAEVRQQFPHAAELLLDRAI